MHTLIQYVFIVVFDDIIKTLSSYIFWFILFFFFILFFSLSFSLSLFFIVQENSDIQDVKYIAYNVTEKQLILRNVQLSLIVFHATIRMII